MLTTWPMQRTLIALCFAVMLAGVAATRTALADPVTTLEQYFAETQTLSGTFTQITRDESGAVIEESTGVFVLARSQRFDWHYKTPWEQRIVSDGAKLWVHDIDLEQVVVRDLDEAMGVGAAQLLSGDMTELRENFTLAGAIEDEAVLLTPTDPAWDFQRVRLELSSGVPTRIFVRDGLGQTIEVRLEDLQANQPLPDDRFEFSPPPGADVLSGS